MGSGWIIIKVATDEQVNYQQISYMTLMGGTRLFSLGGRRRVLKHNGVLYMLACTLCVCVCERERDGEVDKL